MAATSSPVSATTLLICFSASSWLAACKGVGCGGCEVWGVEVWGGVCQGWGVEGGGGSRGRQHRTRQPYRSGMASHAHAAACSKYCRCSVCPAAATRHRAWHPWPSSHDQNPPHYPAWGGGGASAAVVSSRYEATRAALRRGGAAATSFRRAWPRRPQRAGTAPCCLCTLARCMVAVVWTRGALRDGGNPRAQPGRGRGGVHTNTGDENKPGDQTERPREVEGLVCSGGLPSHGSRMQVGLARLAPQV